jgi:hypothetical protein
VGRRTSTLFYAEGNWDAHLDAFAELPKGYCLSCRSRDIFRFTTCWEKFCLSGGVPNISLAYGTPDEVREHCRRIIAGVAGKGATYGRQRHRSERCPAGKRQATIDATREFATTTRTGGRYAWPPSEGFPTLHLR